MGRSISSKQNIMVLALRVWYKDGKEVEFGIVDPSWISIPLDAGTYKVLSDGYKLVVDKKGYFENLEL